MKLLATLVVAAFGQDYDFYSSGEAYRFGSIGDFSHTQTPPVTKEPDGSATIIGTNANSQSTHLTTGIFADSVRYNSFGHGGNRRYCHTTGHQRAIYQWSSSANGGYFAEGRNRMECIGEELYCFIEERAQFGQIIAITAGCEQMMNHPMVDYKDQVALANRWWSAYQQQKDFYNKEAARGDGITTFYGLGGCLAVAAQNGDRAQAVKDENGNTTGFVGTDSYDFDGVKVIYCISS